MIFIVKLALSNELLKMNIKLTLLFTPLCNRPPDGLNPGWFPKKAGSSSLSEILRGCSIFREFCVVCSDNIVPKIQLAMTIGHSSTAGGLELL